MRGSAVRAGVQTNRDSVAQDVGLLANEHNSEVEDMKTIHRTTLVTTLLLALGACADMSRQDKNTAIGAGAGAVGGAVLTGGSAVGTAAGAVVGGVIGHEVKKD